MSDRKKKRRILVLMVLTGILLCTGCKDWRKEGDASSFIQTVVPLSRTGISLHLSCLRKKDAGGNRSILLIHGSSYSSHEFDIDYRDYSPVRFLAENGYSVWLLDIAGYGQSGEVADPMRPDTAWAAEDIHAAVEKIVQETGQDQIDLLGWSWGTMTAAACAVKHPEHIGKLVLYGPILSGLGEMEIENDYSHNTWESAAEDFQKKEDGSFDLDTADPILIGLWCSSCWKYDKDTSPAGWKKDVFVDRNTSLIHLDEISVPTLVICGDRDPYLNYDLVHGALNHLPKGSELQIIPGGSHIVMYEKPYYRSFQNHLISFLKKQDD